MNRRLKKMAMEKSYVQLINSMMIKLSSVPGLDNVVEKIISLVLDNLGGVNLTLYYRIDNIFYSADAYGRKQQFSTIHDPIVKEVFETGKSIELEEDINNTLMIIPEQGKESLTPPPFTSHQMDRSELETALIWIIPLHAGSEIVGVLRMEGMILGGRPVRDQLQAFFSYAALVLKNEIMSFTNLNIINAKLRREIKVRREKETELQKAVESALAANRELEAFAYSVSHDLRAPLRALDGYSRILIEEYESRLDIEGKRICSVISESALNMGKLIDDLLAFSRVGRTAMQYSVVDLSTMAGSIFFELTTPMERKRIDFNVGSLPCTQGDPVLLRQVWMNLLGNAIKFSSKKKQAKIVVSAEQREDEVIYTVQDNGAGFDMAYSDKLFAVFQRLHSVKEFSGTGVGLAIVQRIIQRHGGHIWAKSKPGEGATFHFTLTKL